MAFRSGLRLLTVATLMATLGAGCARLPLAASTASVSDEGFDALSSPINQDALEVARRWFAENARPGWLLERVEDGKRFRIAGLHDGDVLTVTTTDPQETGPTFKVTDFPFDIVKIEEEPTVPAEEAYPGIVPLRGPVDPPARRDANPQATRWLRGTPRSTNEKEA